MHAAQAEIVAILKEIRAVSGPKTVSSLDRAETLIANLVDEVETLRTTGSEVIDPGEWRQYGLTGTEIRMVNAIASAGPAGASKERLMAHAYAHRNVDEWPDHKIIDIFLLKIRRKFLAANAPYWIETIWGEGFALRHGHPEKINRGYDGAMIWHKLAMTKPAVRYREKRYAARGRPRLSVSA